MDYRFRTGAVAVAPLPSVVVSREEVEQEIDVPEDLNTSARPAMAGHLLSTNCRAILAKTSKEHRHKV